MIQQASRQGPVLHTVSRMHHQVAGLVQHHDVIVFVNDIQRDIFGFQGAGFFFGNLVHHHHHARFYAEILGSLRTAYLDFACGNQLLHVGTGHVFHDTHKKLVDALAGMLFIYEIVHI